MLVPHSQHFTKGQVCEVGACVLPYPLYNVGSAFNAILDAQINFCKFQVPAGTVKIKIKMPQVIGVS